MTPDEYIAKRDEFRLKLEIIVASAVPLRVKTARIRAITREIIDLKLEITATVARYQQRP
jgi:hypothetical protein